MSLMHSPQPPTSLLLFLQSAPPQKTFSAFVKDCELCGMPWHCAAAQQLCVALLIRNPLVMKYPPRPSNVCAFLKYFITELEHMHAGACAGPSLSADVEDALSDEGPVHEDVMEAYIGCVSNTSQCDQSAFCYRTFYVCGAPRPFVSVRLAVGQFSNVGLALWPSALVLAQLLMQELSGPSPSLLPIAAGRGLRLLELGSGVGLLPALLSQLRAYRDKVNCFVLTEYQQELIDNIVFNMELQGVAVTPASGSEPNGGGGPAHAVELLDWTEHDQNCLKLRNWGCNVILAADCVYDVTLIPSFVQTLHDALQAASGDGVAVVVQMHRQQETMRDLFLALVETGLSVRSYRLLPTAPSCTPAPDVVLTFQRPLSACGEEGNGGMSFVLVSDEMDSTGAFSGLKGGSEALGSVSGWLGTFFTSMEAVVGIHVVQLQQAAACDQPC
uniref:Uncharacterized protein TCIL3000_11_9440 n=1 Tax=Trypanosoma congolense (strain IL3000) TaxID=1068625 RepID=G0V1F8_TRYCI|nr:unnamed protein product [Trypanosoma congolense IL3000]